MNTLFSLILGVSFLVGCGRKSVPTPETPDLYPRVYPKDYKEPKTEPEQKTLGDGFTGIDTPRLSEIKPNYARR